MLLVKPRRSDEAAAVDCLTSRTLPILEVVMLAPADALPRAVERAGEPQWRRAVARSVQDRCDVSEFDKCEIGRDAYPPYNHRGTVVVASAWLAFCIIAAIHSLAFGGATVTAASVAPPIVQSSR